MDDKQQILNDLAKAKVIFQQRAILAAMEINPDTVLSGTVLHDHGRMETANEVQFLRGRQSD
jgi:hypothetical protein